MFKKIRRASVAGATALALGAYAITVPVIAEAETKTNIDTPLACNLQLSEPVPFAVRVLRGQVEGVYNSGQSNYSNFRVSIDKTEAPDTVAQGEEFDYVIDAGKIGVPAKITTPAVSVDITKASQANIWFEVPANAEVVSVNAEGGQAGLKVKQEGNKIRVWNSGGADVAQWTDSKNDRQNKYKHGGAEATKEGDQYVIDMPKITLRLKATGNPGTEIKPQLPKSDAEKFGNDLPVQIYGNASAIGQNVSGFIRCGLSEHDSYWKGRGAPQIAQPFAAVKIVEPAATVSQPIRVKVKDFEGKDFALGSIATLKVNEEPPKEYRVGQNSIVTLPPLSLKEGESREVTISAPLFGVSDTKTVTGTKNAQPVQFELTRPQQDVRMPVRITATDFNNKPLANANIDVTVGGAPQTVTTNAQGIADFEVPTKENAKVTVTAKTGNSETETREIVGVARPLTAQTTNIALQTKATEVDTKVNVRVLDNQGRPAAAGTPVTVKIEGQPDQTINVGANGIAEFTRKVNEGTEYTATFSISDAEPESVTIKAAANASAPTVTLAPEIQLGDVDDNVTVQKDVNVTVLDGRGNPAANQAVDVTVDGQTQNATTNEQGQATVQVSVKQGATPTATAALTNNAAVTGTGRVLGSTDAANTDITLRMPLANVERKVTISVVDYDGNPVDDAVIEVASEGQVGDVITGKPTPETGATNEPGKRVIVRTIPENESHVLAMTLKTVDGQPVNAEGGNDRLVTFAGDAEDQVVEYKLNRRRADKTVTVEVKVKDANAPEGTEVVLEGEGDFATRRALTDANGVASFRVEINEGEELNLKASLADEPNVNKPIDLDFESDDKTIELRTDGENTNDSENPETEETTREILAKVKGIAPGAIVTVVVNGVEQQVTANEAGKLPIQIPSAATGDIDIVVDGKNYTLNTRTGDTTLKGSQEEPAQKCQPKDLIPEIVGLVLGTIIGIASQFPIPGLQQAMINIQKQLGIFNPQLAGAAERALPAAGGVAGLAAVAGSIASIVDKCVMQPKGEGTSQRQ